MKKQPRLTAKLRAAVSTYRRLKSRLTHPSGAFDRAGRWQPTVKLPCCLAIREPSRAHPYSLMLHCRTIGHVAQLNGYTPSTLRAAVNRLEKERYARFRARVAARLATPSDQTVSDQGEYRVVDGAAFFVTNI